MPRGKKVEDKLFVDYFDEWVETYKVGAIRDVTLQKYHMTGRHLREIVPRLWIDELDRRAYQGIINEYAKTHERQTVVDFHHQIKGCIKDLLHDGLIDRDPTYKVIIKGREPSVKKQKYLDADELKRLVRTLDLTSGLGLDWFTLIVAKTGLRFAEALALTPNDFDFTNNLLNVDKTLEYKSSLGVKFAPTKNESSVRKIVIDWQIVGQLQPLLKVLPPDQPIFAEGGKRIFNSTFNHFLTRKCREAGVTVITYHALRHTHASVLLLAGVTIHSISKRLGHSNVTTTQEIYTHIIKELAAKDDQIMIGTLTAIA